jgi:hypothetical protein
MVAGPPPKLTVALALRSLAQGQPVEMPDAAIAGFLEITGMTIPDFG